MTSLRVDPNQAFVIDTSSFTKHPINSEMATGVDLTLFRVHLREVLVHEENAFILHQSIGEVLDRLADSK
jgi:hypothetical protein